MLKSPFRDDGIYLSALTSLTRLSLSSVTGNVIDHLGILTNMMDLNLFEYCRITDIDLKHLKAFSNISTLTLEHCFATIDDAIRHLSALTSLKTLYLSDATITDSVIIFWEV